MLRGRADLASVFLCFVCLFTQNSHQAASFCSPDMITRVNTLITTAPNLKWLDSRLYTPTFADYQQNCPRSALKCFADELGVLIKEWSEVKHSIGIHNGSVVRRLQALAQSFNQAESGCLQCELLKEENAERFLRDLLSTLEHVNSRFCTQGTS